MGPGRVHVVGHDNGSTEHLFDTWPCAISCPQDTQCQEAKSEPGKGWALEGDEFMFQNSWVSVQLTRAKNARTITYQQFQEAVKELGQKRFKGKKPDEALENIYKLMEGKDPATTGVTVSDILHP